MTFNKRSDKDFISSAPLMQETIMAQLNNVQEKYIEFTRTAEEIKTYEEKLKYANYREYQIFREDMHEKIGRIPLLLNVINNQTLRLKCLDITNIELKKSTKERISMVEKKIIDKNTEISLIINSIVDREKTLLNAGPAILSSQKLAFEDAPERSPRSPILDNFSEEKVVIREVQHNQEYLDARQKELEEIKKISANVVSITDSMKMEAYKQGENLHGIEDNVITVKDNVGKAENEIKEAEKTSRDYKKKILWLVLFILFVVVCIVVILAMIYWG